MKYPPAGPGVLASGFARFGRGILRLKHSDYNTDDQQERSCLTESSHECSDAEHDENQGYLHRSLRSAKI